MCGLCDTIYWIYTHQGLDVDDNLMASNDKNRRKRYSGPMVVLEYLFASKSPLWVKSRHVRRTSRCPLSANSGYSLADLRK